MKWAVKHILLAGFLATPAYADDNNEATRLFEQGRTQREQGDLDAACESFGESYAIERAAGTALNLADCEARAGKKQRSTMAIVPTARGGVLATFEW